jgi:hypothetical protein
VSAIIVCSLMPEPPGRKHGAFGFGVYVI